jgi:hypothetical protein
MGHHPLQQASQQPLHAGSLGADLDSGNVCKLTVSNAGRTGSFASPAGQTTIQVLGDSFRILSAFE